MSVHYQRLGRSISRDRELVSNQQQALLHVLHYEDNLHFNINEGHRTFARQAQLVREQGVWSLANPHGAAVPSASAPHIKTGHPDHALDVDNAQVVINGAKRHGVTYTRTVSTEPWHIEPNPVQLAAFYKRWLKRKRAAARKARIAKAKKLAAAAKARAKKAVRR